MLESADSVTEVVAEHDERGGVPAAPSALSKKRLPFGAWIAITWLIIVIAASFLAPLLPLDDPINDADFLNSGKGWFTDGHLFGVDAIGRDVMSRMVWGGQASLLIAVGSVALGTLVGGFLGLVAGYVGGRGDTFLTALFNILLAFPQLVLALTLVSVLSPATDANPPLWGDRVKVMILAIGIVSIPIFARITRANALAWSRREFVMASRAQGAKSMSTMFREVLPNVLPAMLSIALLGIAVVIVIEGGLALFGLSVTRPNPSWGNMIAGEAAGVDKDPHVWQAPAAAIFLTVLALNYLGDVVRARFDVRESAL